MTRPRDPIRRWFGNVFLTVAVGMLVAGLTLLEPRLKGVDFVVYWLGCFAFTGLAAVMALWDACVVRRQSRREQQRLIEETLAREGSSSRGSKPLPHDDYPENH